MGARILAVKGKRGKIFKTAAAVVAAAGLAVGGIMVGAGQADAATAGCNDHQYWWAVKYSKYMSIPAYTASSGVSSRICTMKRGAGPSGGVGHAVFALQQALKVCYGENLKQDGDFGPGTEAALIRAQKKENIGADGIYGPNTADNLKFPWNAGDLIGGPPCYSFY